MLFFCFRMYTFLPEHFDAHGRGEAANSDQLRAQLHGTLTASGEAWHLRGVPLGHAQPLSGGTQLLAGRTRTIRQVRPRAPRTGGLRAGPAGTVQRKRTDFCNW